MHTQKRKHIFKKVSPFPSTWSPSQPTVLLYLDLVLFYGNTEECSPDPQPLFGHLSVYTETHFILPRALIIYNLPQMDGNIPVWWGHCLLPFSTVLILQHRIFGLRFLLSQAVHLDLST